MVPTSRRRLLIAGLGGALTVPKLLRARDLPDRAPPPELIVRNRLPLDAETPVATFILDLTPNPAFFVRSHFGAPAVGLHPWSLEIGGGVERPMRLSLDELRDRFTPASRRAVLQCSGNGRAFFDPVIPGVAWERGAVGNARWEGVRLREVLERCGVHDGFDHIHLDSADGPPLPKTPAWVRSIPLERAMQDDVLLATRMNGEPLPVLHGGPLRLVVPGWTGNHWMKWLRSIVLARGEAPGFYQQTGYRMPIKPVPPGTTPRPEDLVPVTWMNVKSLIARPTAGATIAAGPAEVRGVAWTGRGRVERVEVEIDGIWRDAELIGPDEEGSWRSWRAPWTAEPGRHTLRSRATDARGETQPETTPWNRSGYLWNGIDRADCEAR